MWMWIKAQFRALNSAPFRGDAAAHRLLPSSDAEGHAKIDGGARVSFVEDCAEIGYDPDRRYTTPEIDHIRVLASYARCDGQLTRMTHARSMLVAQLEQHAEAARRLVVVARGAAGVLAAGGMVFGNPGDAAFGARLEELIATIEALWQRDARILEWTRDVTHDDWTPCGDCPHYRLEHGAEGCTHWGGTTGISVGKCPCARPGPFVARIEMPQPRQARRGRGRPARGGGAAS